MKDSMHKRLGEEGLGYVDSRVHIFGFGRGRGHLEEMHITPGERSEPGDSVHIILLRRPRRGREHLEEMRVIPAWHSDLGMRSLHSPCGGLRESKI